jgi:lactoylglutathione lyase
MKLTHTRLLVIKFPECFRFYRDILQLKPSWGDENDSYASFTQGQDDATIVLAIFRRQGMSEVLGTDTLLLNPPIQDHSMLIVEVEDLDDTVEKMRGQGVKFIKGPTSFPDWGYRGAFLRDPDGNLIELSSELSFDQWSEGLQEASQKWNS